MISDETNSFVASQTVAPSVLRSFHSDPLPGFLSIIIPVYKDVDGLAVTLRSLSSQTLPRSACEILVANDGADPEISDLCRKMGVQEWSLPVNLGSYAARNTALQEARGEFIGFADADVRIDPKWCEAGLKALVNADLAAGKTAIDLGADRRTFELYQYCFAFPARSYVEESGMAQTVNLFVRRAVFSEIGFFDDRLRSGGDLEWTGRATRLGKRLIYAGDALVFHPPRNYRQLLGSSERILYGQIASQKLHGDAQKNQDAPSKSLLRLISPPAPRSIKWMLAAQLSGVEFLKVYFFAWWLKLRSFVILQKVRRKLAKNAPVA